MTRFVTIIELQLFWISFALCGAALLVACRQISKPRSRVAWWKFLSNTHLLIQFLVAEAVGLSIFVPIIGGAFLFQLPIVTVQVCYVLAVLLAIAVLIVYRQLSRTWLSTQWSKRSRSSLGWLLFCGAILVGDALLSLKVGGPMVSDAFVHIAKINQLADGGHFTFADPILGNGVIESRYHVNIVLALHAVAASLFHISAIDAWRYSIPFWRFLVWASLFCMTWEFVAKPVRRRWAYTVLVTGPILYSTMFFCADYPDRAVFIWVVLFLLGLKLFIEKNSSILLCISAVLIATTHPLMAAITLSFLLLVAVILFILGLLPRRRLIIVALLMAILSAPVILTYSFPNHMSQASAHLVLQLQLRHYGPITLARPTNVDPHTWWIWWPLLLAGIVGYVYFIRQARTRALQVTLTLLFVFYSLIIYNPILLAIVGDRVPPWVINRFQEMNVFRTVSSVVGLLVITDWLAKRFRRTWLVPFGTAAVIVGMWAYGAPALKQYVNMNQGFNQDYAQYMFLQSLTPELQNQRVFTNAAFQQLRLPVVMRTNVFIIPDETASPMANIDLRRQCADKYLTASLDISDLQAAGITRLLIDRSIDAGLAAQADKSKDIERLKQTGVYTVYRVPQARAPDHHNPCYIPNGQ